MVTLREKALAAGGGSGSLEVGILALQGDVREHARMLGVLGARVRLVRRPADLDGIAGIVLPGGESTTMDKLARAFGLFEPLRRRLAEGLPALGTCAGLILLADRIIDAAPGQQSLGGLDLSVRRNAFGNQNDSFETELAVSGFDGAAVRATFIRGPVIESLGPRAVALASLDDGRIVAARNATMLALAFHPELDNEPRFHKLFLEMAGG